MYRCKQPGMAFLCFNAGHAEQRLSLKVKAVSQYIFPDPHDGFFRVLVLGQADHMKPEFSVNDGLPGHADPIVDNGCPQDFVLPAEPVKHPSQHLFRGVSVHLENIHQPVCV